MERAGTSPLWVNACLKGVDSEIASFEELVQAEGGTGRTHAIALCILFHPEHATWTRVEVFSGSGVWPVVLYATFKLGIYQNKSPLLRSFDFNVFSPAAKQETGEEVLFNGEAPLLHTFNSIDFDIRPSPWMANLRKLRFYPANILVLLNVLEATPLLEDLELESISTRMSIIWTIRESINPTIVLPHVTLPHLQRIKGRFPLTFFAKVFTHLTFSREYCDIDLCAEPDSTTIPTDQLGLELENAVGGLITQCKQLTRSPFGNSFSLTISEESLHMHTPFLSLEVGTSDNSGLSLMRRPGRNVLAVVLESLSAHVGDVTDFTLEVYHELSPNNPILSSLRGLLKNANSIKCLTLSPCAMMCFFTDSDSQASSSSTASSGFFPSLRTINMSSFSFRRMSDEKDDKFLSFLRNFMISRPTISTFVITNQSEEVFISVRDCLNGVNESLKVEWKKPSYNRAPNTMSRILGDEGSIDALSMLTEILKM